MCNLCICRKEKCHLIGYQPMDPHLRSQYKATLKDSGGPAQVHHKASSARRTRGLSSNLLPETYDDIAAVGLANNGAQYYPIFFVCTSILLFYVWFIIIIKSNKFSVMCFYEPDTVCAPFLFPTLVMTCISLAPFEKNTVC